MLHLLQPDPTQYVTANVTWVTANASLIDVPGNTTVPLGDWSSVLDGWLFENSQNELKSKGSIVANIDPFYTGIYLPQQQAALIHDAILGSALSNLSTLGPPSQGWTLPCNSTFQFDIFVGSQNFTLDQSTLAIDQDLGPNVCMSGIEGWTDASDTTYLLGSLFLHTAYTIFTVSKDGTQTIGFAPRVASPGSITANADGSSVHNSIGPVVGGVLGGFVLIALSLLAFYLIHRRSSRPFIITLAPTLKRTSHKSRGFDVPDFKLPEMIEPFTLWEPSSVQRYNERGHQRRPPRSSSPISIVFSPQPDPPTVRTAKKPPSSYRHHEATVIELPERIYQTRGSISLVSASGSANESTLQTPSITAPSLATMATCG
ncbi:hypothetical protein EIP86_004710 [Pleurotus ostreatoroseus]|nr:hypothetical protein EIP86_004710 [Pleurotus ostreatoroseus]